jgi:hypothetical protein
LGRHSKPSRIRLPRGAPSAAAPTLASVGAAFCLSQQAPPAPSAAQAAAHHNAVLAAYQPSLSPAQLLSATRQPIEQKPDSGLPASYTVRPGDSLSAIAGRLYHNPAAWPVLYWRHRGQVRWANIIETGQVLRIPPEPARIPSPPALLEPPPPVRTVADYTPRPAGPASAPVQAAPVQAAPVQAAAPAASTYSAGVPGGSFQQCVISRESGGSASSVNPASGAGGLYQFLPSTWAGLGYAGLLQDASVATPNAAFQKLYAQSGAGPWSSDGC